MRIVFVSWRDLAHPQAGGSELLVDRLARGCLERGHEAALLCGGPTGQRPYRVVRIGGTYSQYMGAALAHLARFRDWDLVVDVENGIPFFAPLWRRGPVLCLMHHLHSDQWRLRFPAPVAALGQALERHGVPRVYRGCRFMAISQSTAASLQRLGVPEDRITTIESGVDPPRRRFERRDGEPLYVALGRLVPHKRIDLLFRAWSRVRPQVGGRLVVVGDGPERSRLAQQAPPGSELLGRISDEQKWSVLASASLLVHTAQHEGWGLAVMEAAAVGVPTLAFDVPGVRDAVVDGETGLLVGSEDELVSGWMELARDSELRARLGSAAGERARSYDWSATVERFLALAEEAMAGAGR
jgi:glycosyltransferase involved in cell wall biosynthesis